MNTIVPLAKPIMAHGKSVTELELDEANGGTIRQCGMPFRIAKDEIVFDTESVARYIVKLGNIPSSSVDKLSPADFLKLQSVIAGFFGAPIQANASIGTGNLPDSSQE
jgi:hypothetical protein